MADEQIELTKLTVNLGRPARDALRGAAAISGDRLTDTVNRALIVYGEIMQATQREGKTTRIILDNTDGSAVSLRLRPIPANARRAIQEAVDRRG